MKLGVLFSGGKDSTFATFLAKEYGHDVSCLISIISQNKESFMFHTPKIEGIVTGAVESVYQSSRVHKICNELNLECFNPLWQKPQFELLEDLIKKKFEVIVAGVFAYPLDGKWLGRKIDKNFINEMRI